MTNKFLSAVAERRDREMVHAVLGRQLDEEQPMMTCSKCGKTLRKDNKRGICSACQGRGGASSLVHEPAALAEHETTLKQFRAATRALGFDPDELLATYARKWLDRIRASAPAAGDVT